MRVSLAVVAFVWQLCCTGTLQSDIMAIRSNAGMPVVESKPFFIECDVTSDVQLSLRLHCPLVQGIMPCLEDCRKPACTSVDCSRENPELAAVSCSRSVRFLEDARIHIVIRYTFSQTSKKHSGEYICKFRNAMSNIPINVRLLPTTTTASTTTTTTTTKTTTTTATTSTTAAKVPKVGLVTTRPQWTQSTTANKADGAGANTRPPSTTPEGRLVVYSTESGLSKAGWFGLSLIDTLSLSDIILASLLCLLSVIWVASMACICWRQRLKPHAASAHERRNGGRGSVCLCFSCCGESKQQQQQQQQQQQRLLGPGHGAAERRHASRASDTTSTQEYAEPTDDCSDGFYRLQGSFGEQSAASNGIMGGSQRGLSHFTRDLPARRSLQNVRMAKPRPCIPLDLLQSVNEQQQQQQQPVNPEEIARQIDQQQQEIDELRRQLRDSQLQLWRMANSQHDLRRSVSATRLRHEPPATEYAEPIRPLRASADLVEAITEEASDGTLMRKRRDSITEAYGTATLPHAEASVD